jgi:coniferyl-aldehyde dehydrogenase
MADHAVSLSPASAAASSGAVASRSSTDLLHRRFDTLRAAFDGERYPDAAMRQDRLRRIHRLVTEHEGAWVQAITRDFGQRSPHESRLAECYIVAAAARHAMQHLPRWMRPRRVPTPLHLWPARSLLVPQPLGGS